ncbi:unnamed protein product [Enterobius vermicularis]|uniref:Splicing factor U2AF 26 kDa subunit n=1 Tax=Enterobius vermicularis TaxID=51028 RepID=A0A0N4VBC8_ENTVE|nr:unnamed protein product [Enterobius vermicularis]
MRMTLSFCPNGSSSKPSQAQPAEPGCPFYKKIGACRHGTKCSRSHIVPESSKTIILKNFHCGFDNLVRPGSSESTAQHDFDDFYVEVYTEIDEQYGKIEEMIVSDNVGEHMIGNVYIKFCDESNARKAVDDLNNRWFDGRPIHCEFSPVQDFKAACCRQYDHGECDRGKFCNFLHLKQVSMTVKKKLLKRRGRMQKKRLKAKSSVKSKRKEDDDMLPKKYQNTSSTEESWSDNDVDTRTSISESSTPNAFREDRYPSDASDSVSDDDSIVITHMQMLRRQKWEELRSRLSYHPKWDDDRERNFVFSLL